MNIKVVKAALAALVLSISSFANAGLITNGNIISDDVSGLDWFKLTATTGNSFNTMSAKLLDSNSSFYGFSYASFDQLAALLLNAGYIHTLNDPSSNNGKTQNASSSSKTALATLIGVFGDTTNSGRTNGIYDREENGDKNLFDFQPDNGNLNNPRSVVYSGIEVGVTDTTWNNSDIGHWLVRATPTQGGGTTAVPEPSTLAIFALAMFGLFSRRVKK